jgi:threonine synthase
VHVLVATSGDTGSAVANGFLGVDGIHVHVLYPKGKVSKIQESQFTTLGQNVTALEVDGTFDDCQHLVKTAFLNEELNKQMIADIGQLNKCGTISSAGILLFQCLRQVKRNGNSAGQGFGNISTQR